MDKTAKKKEELQDITKKVNALKRKNKTLLSEREKSEKTKDILTGKLEHIKHAITLEQVKKKDLIVENNKAAEELKEIKSEVAQERSRIRALQDVLNFNTDEYNANKEKLEAEKDIFHELEKQFKKEKQDLANEKDTFYNKEKPKLIAEIKDIKHLTSQELKSLQEKNEAVDKKLAELDVKIEIAKATKEIHEGKIKETKELNEDVKQLKTLYQQAKKDVDANNSRLQETISALEIEKQAHINAKTSFERQIQALDTREKEIKIRELRVKKFKKDKQLDEELKRLEESLK